MLDMSMTRVGDPPVAAPSGPKVAAPTMAALGSERMTTPASAASSGLDAALAPNPTARATASWFTSNARTSCPVPTSRVTMADPITPNPTTPTP